MMLTVSFTPCSARVIFCCFCKTNIRFCVAFEKQISDFICSDPTVSRNFRDTLRQSEAFIGCIVSIYHVFAILTTNSNPSDACSMCSFCILVSISANTIAYECEIDPTLQTIVLSPMSVFNM
eukprot:157216_1